jgi:DNA-directed RNA polymerase subunit N (RpoN/RPB10)
VANCKFSAPTTSCGKKLAKNWQKIVNKMTKIGKKSISDDKN